MKDGVFYVGQHVVYGVHGVCLIEDIRDISLSSALPPQKYYILKQIKKGSVIYVPCSNGSGSGKLRSLVSPEDIDRMLYDIRGRRMEWNINRKERTVQFREILNKGLSPDLILMIRCISNQKAEYLESKKKLSGSDSDILQSAENMMNQEFAFVLGKNEEDIPEFVKETLEA